MTSGAAGADPSARTPGRADAVKDPFTSPDDMNDSFLSSRDPPPEPIGAPDRLTLPGGDTHGAGAGPHTGEAVLPAVTEFLPTSRQ